MHQIVDTFTGEIPAYKYDPLPEGKWIRLLRLQPGSLGDTIVCSLLVSEIKNAPPYDAISYAWGDKNDTLDIYCDGRRLKVRVNIHDALQHIRSPSKILLLWADAICINQINLQERGSQVNHMGEVYSRAERVLIWVSRDTEGDAVAARDLILEVNKHFNDAFPGYASMDDVPLLPPDSPLLIPERWKAVQTFYCRPWFSRVWVLQEVGLARKAVVLYGTLRFSWAPVIGFVMLLANRVDLQAVQVYLNIGRLCDTFEAVWSAKTMESSWEDASPYVKDLRNACIRSNENLKIPFKQWTNILMTGSRFEASDPRDHVYAFLGHPAALSRDDNKPLVDADYSLQRSDLYWITAVRLLEKMKRLDVLSVIEHSNGAIPTDDASWVPQWNSRSRGVLISPVSGHLPYFDADLQNGTVDAVVVEPLRDLLHGQKSKRHLRLHGLILGTLNACSAVMYREDFHCKTGENMHDGSKTNPVESAWNLTNKNATETVQYPNRQQALGLTMATGRNENWNEAEKHLKKYDRDFQVYCRQYCDPGSGLVKSCPLALKGDEEYATSFLVIARTVCQRRKFFTATDGRFGIGLGIIQEGDICCILFGSSVPFIIRRTSEASHYRLVGECYIHGIMHGEAIHSWKEGKLEDVDIILI
jgi:hypothetical protein